MQSKSQSFPNFRQFLDENFKEMQQRGENMISLASNFSGIFDRVTSPNEFTGPLVEAWAHIQLGKILEQYTSASARGQEFADARAEFQGQPILLNIKAKDRNMNARSRINLSSFQRYKSHYSQPNPTAFYVVIFEYEWRPQQDRLMVIIERLKYTFNLLEIPLHHYKIEGAFEGSHRIFISPIPDGAKTESSTYPIITPAQFLQRLEELRDTYIARKGTREKN